MADQEESKKDTVRINLPVGVTGRSGGSIPPGPPTQKLKPEQEAKKETAVMGAPVPAAKKDTSRVQVAAAKPSAPEMPRPTVRLRREESAPSAPAAAPVAPVAVAHGPAVATAASGADIVLAIGAMLLSIGVLVYLVIVVRG